MKTQIIQDEPQAAPAPEPAAHRRAGGTAFVVLGSLAALLALVLLVSGGALLYAGGKRDDAGYVSGRAHRLSTPSSALVVGDIDIDSDVPSWLGSDFASRLQVRSAGPVFVGVGRTAAVDRYLASTRHAQITDFDTDPFRVQSHLAGGAGQAAAPAAQSFWRVRSSGPGTRTVTWPVERGRWSAVVMNADGSAGVDVSATLGAHIPALTGIADGVLVGGVLVGIAAGLLLRAGTHRTRRSR
jgi:hypothetical protein